MDGEATTNANEAIKIEVLINSRMYDVTNMKHPGGRVIEFYAGKGIDATQAFENFHLRSQKANRHLDILPSRPVDVKDGTVHSLPGQKELLAEFEILRLELEAEGFFKPSLPHVIYRCTEILLMYLVGGYLVLHNNVITGIVLMALAQGRCGWVIHEAGHYSLTGNMKIDKFLQEMIMGLGMGMSAGWWRSSHNKHHAMPQKLEHDVDLNTMPLIAFTEKICTGTGLPGKLWIRIQSFMFPGVTTVVTLLIYQFYWHPQHTFHTKGMKEAMWLITRYVLWTGLITVSFGLAQSALMYLAYTWITANYLFLHFAVSHTHLPTVSSKDTQVDWVRYAADYTIDVKPGPFNIVNWIMGYLNYQVEHHLFPCMPQFRHPVIAPRVKAFFERHGLKYDQRGYLEAFTATFSNIHNVGYEVFLG